MMARKKARRTKVEPVSKEEAKINQRRLEIEATRIARNIHRNGGVSSANIKQMNHLLNLHFDRESGKYGHDETGMRWSDQRVADTAGVPKNMVATARKTLAGNGISNASFRDLERRFAVLCQQYEDTRRQLARLRYVVIKLANKTTFNGEYSEWMAEATAKFAPTRANS